MSVNKEDHTLAGLGNELFEIIGVLALDLHVNRSEELDCDLPAGRQWVLPQINSSDFLIEENIVRFPSIEARNRFVASYVFKKNQEAFENNAQMWLTAGEDLWRCEIGKPDTASGRLLALVHKNEDLFTIAVTAIEHESMRVFEVLSLVEATLPYLDDLTANQILKLCAAQHEQTKNDFAGGIFFNKLEKTLVNHQNTCRTIHDHLRMDPLETTSSLYPVVLIALSKSELESAVKLALTDAQSSNIILKSKALWTLGLLLSSQTDLKEMIPNVLSTIINNMSDPIEKVRTTAIYAAANVVMIADAFIEPLSKLAEADNQDALAAIANIMMLNIKEMKTKTFFNEWVKHLCKLTSQSNLAIDNFDQILRQLLSEEAYRKFVISCLTEWAKLNSKDIPRDKSIPELFDGTMYELANQPVLLSQMITEWFLSDFKQLASAATGVLSHLLVRGLKNPEFDPQRLNTLDQKNLVFLARRMLGYVSSEEHLISLTMSFLKTKNAETRTFGIVHSLLVDEIGEDYPESTINILTKAKDNSTEPDWIKFYSLIVDGINEHLKSLEALPNLVELRPSPSLQRKFALAREKQMNNATEEAQKKSIIRQLATEIPIKAGHAWFNFREGSYTDSSYMQSFSHSVAIPRRHVFDSVGYDINRLFMRLAKREDE